jgi:hypothetical protein
MESKRYAGGSVISHGTCPHRIKSFDNALTLKITRTWQTASVENWDVKKVARSDQP